MSECEGCEPGWCERHKCNKSPRMVELCGSDEHPSYWLAWENGYGPGQKRPTNSKPVTRKLHDPVCVHRGDKIGTADCGCAGKPKVYQCGIHGFAMDRKLKPGKVPVVTSEGKQHLDVTYCNACDDFATS